MDVGQEQQERISLEVRLAQLASVFDELGTLEETLRAVTEAAVELVPGCEAASITLRRGNDRMGSVAPTAAFASEADHRQYTLDEGPCLDAARENPLVVSADVATDGRWPRWGPAVRDEHGVAGMLSIQLFSARAVHGALNLYSREPDAFDADAVALASVLSVHAGIAMRTSLLEQDLAAAVESRRLIGQAQGILMERFGLDPEAAFAVLRRLSQSSNVRVIEIAQRLVRERETTPVPD